jgi:hypothetical protein
MHAADSKIRNGNIVSERLGGQMPDHLRAEAVVAQKNVPDSRDENAAHHIAIIRR